MNHKPLVSSAPVHSILNAGFRYTNSTATDIRKTFARIRREQASVAVKTSAAGNVRPLARRSPEPSSPRRVVCE